MHQNHLFRFKKTFVRLKLCFLTGLNPQHSGRPLCMTKHSTQTSNHLRTWVSVSAMSGGEIFVTMLVLTLEFD